MKDKKNIWFLWRAKGDLNFKKKTFFTFEKCKIVNENGATSTKYICNWVFLDHRIAILVNFRCYFCHFFSLFVLFFLESKHLFFIFEH